MMKMKVLIIVLILGLIIGSLIVGYYINEKDIETETNNNLNEDVWYPESLESCQKQKAILLDEIEQLEGNE